MAEIIQYSDDSGDVRLVRIVNQMVFVRNETPFAGLGPDAFETRYAFVEGTLIVCLNGLRQREGAEHDYVCDGNSQGFRFNHPVDPDDSVIVDYIKIL